MVFQWEETTLHLKFFVAKQIEEVGMSKRNWNLSTLNKVKLSNAAKAKARSQEQSLALIPS